jgi:copper chaperone NosL
LATGVIPEKHRRRWLTSCFAINLLANDSEERAESRQGIVSGATICRIDLGPLLDNIKLIDQIRIANKNKVQGEAMKKILLLPAIVLFFCIVGVVVAMDLDDIVQYGSCKYCGMDRQKFAQSRMLIGYDDGSTSGLCSLHCAALELANEIDKMPETLKVGDFNTKELVNAEEAIWVIGGDLQGAMSGRAKWAFASKESAGQFTAEHGGEIASFEDAVKAAYEDMYQDTRMIRQKRKEMKHMKMEGSGSTVH